MEIDLTKKEMEYLLMLVTRDVHERCHPRSDARCETSEETHNLIGSLYSKLKERTSG